MNQKNIDKLITEVLAIEEQEAKEAGAMGFMARALVQATMPHKDPGKVEAWGRRNGNFSMVMQPGYVLDQDSKPQSIGLPYGTKPRLVMAFISSEAVKTHNQEILLGKSLAEFMRQLNLIPSGGRWGTIPALKEQMKRLFSSTISFQYDGKEADISGGFRIASKAVVFWDNQSPDQTGLWPSTVTLTKEFYDEIIERPVPIDMRTLSALKGSSLALDIYYWLTYRMSYLKKSTPIPWELLQAQFGAGYAFTPQGKSDFKRAFKRELQKVHAVYRDVTVRSEKNELILYPSRTHISRKK